MRDFIILKAKITEYNYSCKMGRKKMTKADELSELHQNIDNSKITNKELKKYVSKLNQPKKLKYTKWD